MQPPLRNVIGMEEVRLLEKGGEGTFGTLHDWPAVKGHNVSVQPCERKVHPDICRCTVQHVSLYEGFVKIVEYD